jgi:sugar phosphate isomerase/epimerase
MVARGVWADEKPYIHLHKARKGRAALKVSLPDGRAFISGMQQQIRRIGQEINIIHYDEVRKATGPYWYTISESNLDIRRPIPTDGAIYFAQALARILERAGYFARGVS